MEKENFCLKCGKKIIRGEKAWKIYESNFVSCNFFHDGCFEEFKLEKISKDLKNAKK